jgi:hypothetical protein
MITTKYHQPTNYSDCNNEIDMVRESVKLTQKKKLKGLSKLL